MNRRPNDEMQRTNPGPGRSLAADLSAGQTSEAGMTVQPILHELMQGRLE